MPEAFTTHGLDGEDVSCEDHTEQTERVDVLELDDCTLYWEQTSCENCPLEKTGYYLEGTRPQTAKELAEFVYELYEDLYREPRSIAYPALMEPTHDLDEMKTVPATNLLSSAVDLGCRDKEAGREKRTFNEVVEYFST
ncbi:hypothetical protein [Salinarchaeum laminariae]|uniref:hypothetical protein n=1 Tax=Salinarchaeum laminariae TaxID=869888 RepID=UPI0020BDE056|nr:hypothetical protein [Salinarchaeum laminariae]